MDILPQNALRFSLRKEILGILHMYQQIITKYAEILVAMKDHFNGASDQKLVWLKFMFFILIFTHYTWLYKLQQWCQKSDVNLHLQCWKFESFLDRLFWHFVVFGRQMSFLDRQLWGFWGFGHQNELSRQTVVRLLRFWSPKWAFVTDSNCEASAVLVTKMSFRDRQFWGLWGVLSAKWMFIIHLG